MPFTLASLFAAVTVYAIARAVAAMGFGFVVYTGVSALEDQFMLSVSQNLGSVPVAVLQIATLFGFVEYAKIVLGATSVRLAMMTFKKFMPI